MGSNRTGRTEVEESSKNIYRYINILYLGYAVVILKIEEKASFKRKFNGIGFLGKFLLTGVDLA
jgi:hypothetical protein